MLPLSLFSLSSVSEADLDSEGSESLFRGCLRPLVCCVTRTGAGCFFARERVEGPLAAVLRVVTMSGRLLFRVPARWLPQMELDPFVVAVGADAFVNEAPTSRLESRRQHELEPRRVA